MKNTFLAFVLLICFASCKHHSPIWTEAYYTVIYSKIYGLYTPIFKDEKQRKEITTYVVNQLKIELPDGMGSVSTDSLNRLCKKIGEDYARKNKEDLITAKMPWSKTGEEAFKDGVMGSNFIKKIDKSKRNQYCDCLLVELKNIFPDSIQTPLPDSVYSKIVSRCNQKFSLK